MAEEMKELKGVNWILNVKVEKFLSSEDLPTVEHGNLPFAAAPLPGLLLWKINQHPL